jgi:hypothetical protein
MIQLITCYYSTWKWWLRGESGGPMTARSQVRTSPGSITFKTLYPNSFSLPSWKWVQARYNFKQKTIWDQLHGELNGMADMPVIGTLSPLATELKTTTTLSTYVYKSTLSCGSVPCCTVLAVLDLVLRHIVRRVRSSLGDNATRPRQVV